jgi:hypothetical protein
MSTPGPSYPEELTPEQEAAQYQRIQEAEAKKRLERNLEKRRAKDKQKVN